MHTLFPVHVHRLLASFSVTNGLGLCVFEVYAEFAETWVVC